MTLNDLIQKLKRIEVLRILKDKDGLNIDQMRELEDLLLTEIKEETYSD